MTYHHCFIDLCTWLTPFALLYPSPPPSKKLEVTPTPRIPEPYYRHFSPFAMRPCIKIVLFPVYRPDERIRADWVVFVFIFSKCFFLSVFS